MVQIGCPSSGGAILSDEIPARLPIMVPDHLFDDRPCLGSGRASSQAWMVNPFVGADRPAPAPDLGRQGR
jgi:hypothetical protein